MIQLQAIETMLPLRTLKLAGGFWRLTSDFWVRLHTSEGVIDAKMKTGWVTDYRSGSSAVDVVVPKKGNQAYNSIIMIHDLAYSGHLTKNLADELLRQGMILAGIASWRARLAFMAVQAFGRGGYYYLTDDMPEPYTDNRALESLKWGAK